MTGIPKGVYSRITISNQVNLPLYALTRYLGVSSTDLVESLILGALQNYPGLITEVERIKGVVPTNPLPHLRIEVTINATR